MRFAKAAQFLYASEATLVAQDGVLQTSDGAVIIPRIHVPASCSRLDVSLDGTIRATGNDGTIEVSQIVLTMLPDNLGRNGMFKSTLHGAVMSPGEGMAGVIRTSTPKVKPSARPTTAPEEPAAGLMKIVVAASSEIDNDEMTLGDIATFTGPKARRADAQVIDLGRTPQLGSSIHFSEGFIVTRLRLAGFKPDDFEIVVPEGATVTRPTQTVTCDQLTEAAIAAIKERYDVGVDLKIDSKVPDMKIPRGDLFLSAQVGSKTDRSITVYVSAEVGGKRVGSRSLTLVPSDEAIGVKVGDQVTIRVCSNGATVEVPGKVKSAGWVGQSVSVHSDTGIDLTGKVISSNVVEVRI